MDSSTLLATYAQVSIGFLGFTGLVSILSPREWESPLISLRFWILIEFSLGGLILALAPMVLFHWGLSETAIWRGLSFAFLGLFGVHGTIFIPRILKLTASGDWPGVPAALNVPMLAALALCFLSQVLTAIGLFPAEGGYQMGLLLLTFMTAWNFAGMLYVLKSMHGSGTKAPKADVTARDRPGTEGD